MKEVEENKKENNQNREEINFEKANMHLKNFGDAEKISSLINSIKEKQIQNNSEIIKDLKTGIDLEEKKIVWKLICLLGKIRKMEDKLPVFFTQEINLKIPFYKLREIETKLSLSRFSFLAEDVEINSFKFKNIKTIFTKFAIFLKDHFHLIFKSAKNNYERISNQDTRYNIQDTKVKNAESNLKFKSFNHLERYQKKVRKITFSFSSVLAMVLIAAVMITYVFKPSGAEASAFQFAQSSWAGGVSADAGAHPTNKTNWTKYSAKDATTAAVAGGVSLTQASSASVTDNGVAGGTLTALSPATVATGGTPNDVLISPDGTSVYVVNGGTSRTISMYSRNTSTGALTALSPATIATGTNANYATISPDGTSVYAANYDGNTVSLYSRNTSTGALTAMSPATIATEANPDGINTSADGTSVYVANYSSNTVSMYSRNTSTGALTAMSPATIGTGSGPGASPAISANGTSMYVANYGANTISMYSRNTSTGALTAMSPATIATGIHPYDITISADGTSVYVANYDGNTVSLYSRNTSTGALTALSPTTIATGTNPAAINISADGTSVYAANYGANTISMYSRNTSTGALTAMSPATIATGARPNTGMTISADGTSVYVANSVSDTVSMYSRSTAPGFGAGTLSSTAISGSGASATVGLGTTTISSYASSTSFAYAGSVASWTVPAGVTSITIAGNGAGGNSGSRSNSDGGAGGSSTGTLSVTPGTTYYIAVGGTGSGTTGGYGGGGSTGSIFGVSGGGGGGMTWLSTASTFAQGTVILVAGGGGGGGENTTGGVGGGTTASNGSNSGFGTGGGGGTQSAGGSGGTSGFVGNGSAGNAGVGGGGGGDGGGGGGGYYGGGGGAVGGGGGGSGFLKSTLTATSTTAGAGAATATNGSLSISYTVNNPASISYSGGVAPYFVPAGAGLLTVTANGAGGVSAILTSNGGRGGSSTGTLAVTPGATYYVAVGGTGSGATGGYGGGGNGYSTGGGGMTWLSSASTFAQGNVLLVAGGGGGGGNPYNSGGNGGNGGGDNGTAGAGSNSGGYGTQSAGGAGGGGGANGTAGVGGNGGATSATYGSGGGGGYYGGGGGGYYENGAGGGGSGFVKSTLTATSTTQGSGAAASTNGSASITAYGYNSSGTFTSGVIDTGASSAFSTLSYVATLNGQTLTINARAGNTATPDGTWTDWTSAIASGGSIASLSGKQYIQYKADFSTTDTSATPTLSSVTINYGGYSTSGTLTSSIYDSGNSANTITNMLWSASGTSGTETVKFQVRSASTSGGIATASWCGPADTSSPCSGTSYFTTNTGDAIPANSPLKTGGDDEFFQYKITLASGGFATPTVTSATVQYSYNVAPTISSVTYTQNSNGTVTVPYILSETYDDAGNLAHGTAAAPIKALLFYEPDSGVTAPVLDNSQTGIITLTNTNSEPLPTSGSLLIDNELITFDSTGATGNQRNILARGASFATSFPTTAAAHSAGASVFFNSSSAVQTINTFSATGTAGTNVSTSGNSFTWDPRADSTNNLNNNKLTALLLKVVANDGDVSTFNTIGQSSVTAAQTLDLLPPNFTTQYYSDSGLTASLGTNPKLKAGTYYIKVSASEALASAPTISIAAEGTANDVTNGATTLVSGNDYKYTRTISSDAAAVGSTIESFSVTGTDSFSNVATSVNPTDEATKAGYTDTTAPTATIAYSNSNPVKSGASLTITATFNESMADSPVPKIAISGSNTLSATNMTKTDATHYYYVDTVGAGNGTATVALSTGTDVAGNIININSANTSIDFNTEGNYTQQDATNGTDFGSGVAILHGSSTSATGGTITYTDSNGLNPRSSPSYAGGYTVHTFTSGGTLMVTNGGNASCLVVAGGGSGSSWGGGGGGGGGVVYNPSFNLTAQTYTVTVGNGGTKVTNTIGNKGGNSVFSTIIAEGGGPGGFDIGDNKNGGCGGGSGNPADASGGTGSQGGNGGTATASYGWTSGGGGGAGGNGLNGSTGKPDGGIGYSSNISGAPTYYAGGGGGSTNTGTAGSGGLGGGTDGVKGAGNASDVTANTGGGSGAARVTNYYSGNAGSGIVIVRYPSSSSVYYPISQSYYVTTASASQLNTSNWIHIGGITFTQTTPTNASIKYLVSFDNRSTWKYWNGSAWQTTTLSNANMQSYGKTKAEIEAITQNQWEASGGFVPGSTTTLDFAADLKTTDANVTPSLDNIQVNYLYNLTPANNTFTVDNTAPTAAITYSTSDPVKSGAALTIAATFNEDMADSPVPKIAISGGNTLAATAMTKGADATHYSYVDTVGAGNGTATVALSTGTDIAGNVVTSVPNSGATFVADNTAPTSVGTPTLSSYLNNSGNTTVSWSQTTETYFKDYLVQRKNGVGGTFATIGSPITNIATLSYADNSALAEGTYYYQIIAEDVAGNMTASNTSSAFVVDKTAPILQSFNSSSTNSNISDPLTFYGTGDTINVQAIFNENIGNGSTMTVKLENTAQSQVLLNQVSGNVLSGTYTVSGPGSGTSDDSPDVAINSIVSESVSDAATNVRGSESVPTGQNLSDNKNLIVDTVPPSLQSFSATGGNYKAGDNITITAHYNKSVKSSSNIHVKINSDGGTNTIDMTTVSNALVSGTYTVQASDNTQNLKVSSIVSQAVADIKNNQLTDTVMPETNISDGVLVDTTNPVIIFSDDVDSNPNQSDTVNINVVELNPASDKYIFSSDNVCNNKNYNSATSFGSDTPIIFNTENNNTKYICTKVTDTSGNINYQASVNPLNIDITAPTGTILINRSLESGQIQLTAGDGSRGIAGLQMRSVTYNNDSSDCDLSAATWGDFTDTLDLTSSSELVKACVEYKDVAGNTTILSATPPRNPVSFQYFDVSDPSDYRVFLSWKIPTDHEGSKGFYQYQLFQCSDLKDKADCSPDINNPPDAVIDNESTNYKTYFNLLDTDKYCYQVRFASHDVTGTDYSALGEKRCVVPSSASSSVTKDVAIQLAADPVPDNELFANQATIHWDTVNANDPNEPLPASSEVCWRVHLLTLPGLGWNCRSYESYETEHAITISKATERMYDLMPNTVYDYQVRSETSWGKNATVDGLTTFTTKDGAIIKNINTDPIGNTTATVSWTTENKDGDPLASSSSLWYAAGLSNGDLVTPKEAACDDSDVASHSCTLAGLSLGTQYYFYVESTINNATSRDSANGEFYRFTTLSDITPPLITPNTDNPLIVTDTQAALSWETDERANAWLLYGTANHESFDNFVDLNFDPTNTSRNPYANYLSGDSSNLAHTFIMSLNLLTPSTTYHYRMVSEDTSGNVSVSDEESFTTLPIQETHLTLTNPGNPLIAQYSDTEAVVYLPAANTEALSKICWDINTIADMDNCANHSEINTPTKSHYYHLTGLTPNKTYHIMTKISDSETPDVHNYTSSDITFETKKEPEFQHVPMTEITNISTSLITDENAIVTFKTDQDALCMAEATTSPGNYANPLIFQEEGYTQKENYTSQHSLKFTGLIFDTTYYYKLTCEDNLGTVKSNTVPAEPHFKTLEKQYGASLIPTGDTTKPQISNVAVGSITGESATIIWDTDEKANSMVSYAQENSITPMMAGDITINLDKANFSTSHTVTINGLTSNIKYIFTAIAYDVSGNISQSAESSFTTADASSISNIKVVSKAMGQADITWTTNAKISSTVDYGLDTTYGKTKQDSTKTNDHEIILTELTPGGTYHFRVKGEDAEKNIFASSDITFQPNSPPKISNFKISSIYEHGATITFDTNVPTNLIVTYVDAKNADNSGFQGLPTIASKHEITLKNMISGVDFSLKLKVRDEDGNETEEDFPGFTTGKDENPPKIDNVHTDSALTQSDKVQTIITWKTDEQSTSTLIYREGRNGEEKEYKNTDNLSTNHVIVMTSFKSGTVYNFRVKSSDASENTAISEYFSFLTPKMQQNIIQIITNNFMNIFGWTNKVGK